MQVSRIRSFLGDERGATMVEFAICIALFLLILFAILDFGRLGYNWVVTEKAMQKAVRIASVRPPVCAGVPLYHARESGLATTYSAGTLCSTDGGICEQVNVQCLLSNADGDSADAQASADEIWTALQNLVPNDATRANILLHYSYDRRLGFIGGPYVPVITAELVGPANGGGYDDFMFTFVTPLSALAATAGSTSEEQIPGTIPFPDISVTLPAEDMNQGVQG